MDDDKPKKPQIMRSLSGMTWWYICRVCKQSVNFKDEKCGFCGRRLDWTGKINFPAC